MSDTVENLSLSNHIYNKQATGFYFKKVLWCFYEILWCACLWKPIYTLHGKRGELSMKAYSYQNVNNLTITDSFTF